MSLEIGKSAASSASHMAMSAFTLPRIEELFMSVEATPRSRFDPARLWMIFCFDLMISKISLDVVVFPLVPDTTMDFRLLLEESFLTRSGSILSAYSPGAAVAPDPESLLRNEMILPVEIANVNFKSTMKLYYGRCCESYSVSIWE